MHKQRQEQKRKDQQKQEQKKQEQLRQEQQKQQQQRQEQQRQEQQRQEQLRQEQQIFEQQQRQEQQRQEQQRQEQQKQQQQRQEQLRQEQLRQEQQRQEQQRQELQRQEQQRQEQQFQQQRQEQFRQQELQRQEHQRQEQQKLQQQRQEQQFQQKLQQKQAQIQDQQQKMMKLNISPASSSKIPLQSNQIDQIADDIVNNISSMNNKINDNYRSNEINQNNSNNINIHNSLEDNPNTNTTNHSSINNEFLTNQQQQQEQITTKKKKKRRKKKKNKKNEEKEKIIEKLRTFHPRNDERGEEEYYSSEDDSFDFINNKSNITPALKEILTAFDHLLSNNDKNLMFQSLLLLKKHATIPENKINLQHLDLIPKLVNYLKKITENNNSIKNEDFLLIPIEIFCLFCDCVTDIDNLIKSDILNQMNVLLQYPFPVLASQVCRLLEMLVDVRGDSISTSIANTPIISYIKGHIINHECTVEDVHQFIKTIHKLGISNPLCLQEINRCGIISLLFEIVAVEITSIASLSVSTIQLFAQKNLSIRNGVRKDTSLREKMELALQDDANSDKVDCIQKLIRFFWGGGIIRKPALCGIKRPNQFKSPPQKKPAH